MNDSHATLASRRAAALSLEWGKDAILRTSCVGGSDEHTQIWHPDAANTLGGMPSWVCGLDGTDEAHPDSEYPTVSAEVQHGAEYIAKWRR
jgi:hypothetical protein